LPRAVGCNHRTVLCSSKSGGLSTERHPSIAVGVRFLVAWASVRDLLLCAKHLFVAAMVAGCAQHPRQGAGSPAGASLKLPWCSAGEAGGEGSSVPWAYLERRSTGGCFTPVSDRRADIRNR